MQTKFIAVIKGFMGNTRNDFAETYYSHLEFFEAEKEMLEWASKNCKEYEIDDVYDINGNKLYSMFIYSYNYNKCIQISYSNNGVKYRAENPDSLDMLIWKPVVN